MEVAAEAARIRRATIICAAMPHSQKGKFCSSNCGGKSRENRARHSRQRAANTTSHTAPSLSRSAWQCGSHRSLQPLTHALTGRAVGLAASMWTRSAAGSYTTFCQTQIRKRPSESPHACQACRRHSAVWIPSLKGVRPSRSHARRQRASLMGLLPWPTASFTSPLAISRLLLRLDTPRPLD